MDLLKLRTHKKIYRSCAGGRDPRRPVFGHPETSPVCCNNVQRRRMVEWHELNARATALDDIPVCNIPTALFLWAMVNVTLLKSYDYDSYKTKLCGLIIATL